MPCLLMYDGYTEERGIGHPTSTETLAKNGIITPIFTENMLKNVFKLTDYKSTHRVIV